MPGRTKSSSKKKKKKSTSLVKDIQFTKWSGTFKLPPDIMVALKKEFPAAKHIEEIVDSALEKIFQKTISDGACTIMRFGCFFAYKTFSSRLKTVVPRVKFALSRTMRKNLQEDKMIMDQIPEYRGRDDRLDVVENMKKPIRNERARTESFNKATSKKKTQERVAQDEIASILGENFND